EQAVGDHEDPKACSGPEYCCDVGVHHHSPHVSGRHPCAASRSLQAWLGRTYGSAAWSGPGRAISSEVTIAPSQPTTALIEETTRVRDGDRSRWTTKSTPSAISCAMAAGPSRSGAAAPNRAIFENTPDEDEAWIVESEPSLPWFMLCSIGTISSPRTSPT